MGNIVGLTGFAGHGKSSVAKIITQHYSNCVEVSFGDAVKDICSVMFDWPRDMLQGETIESRKWRETPDKYWSNVMDYDFTPRHALQWLATDVVRNRLCESFWLDKVKLKIKKLWEENSDLTIVIPDVRFRNEIDFIQNMNGKIWQISLGDYPSWFYKVEDIAWKLNGRKPNDENYTYQDLKSAVPLGVHLSEYDWIGQAKWDVWICPQTKGLNKLKELVIDACENRKEIFKKYEII